MGDEFDKAETTLNTAIGNLVAASADKNSVPKAEQETIIRNFISARISFSLAVHDLDCGKCRGGRPGPMGNCFVRKYLNGRGGKWNS